uniref:At4g15545-like C-terminal domain-containing protein n=1 Tax=Kalanchoe fedtschenkoi TaxID=63787 RepID=A0A7N0V9J6_KALFE
MSQGGGPDFNLPDEILSVIPTDPYDQLDLARKITSMAIASRVSNLETDTARMRQTINDKDRKIHQLEEKLASLQNAFHDSEARLQNLLVENTKLIKERDTLSVNAKKLSRDLSKLETFKRQLMQSLKEDSTSPAATVDIQTCDQPMPKAYPVQDDETNGCRPPKPRYASIDSCLTSDDPPGYGTQFSMTPYITPRLTPTGTPKVISTNGSPRGYSVGGSPKGSGFVSPTRYKVENRSTLSWYSASQQSSSANSPPKLRPHPGHTSRIDGKEFFRQARSRLTYEQFSAFLANIKELNAQKQSREDTLKKAEEIFGAENKDLFLSFQGLLNRNIH